jgi:alanyl-tRNA synthetase
MDQREAIGRGAMALFGEKYGDVVRTITIGDDASTYSLELCGGLHVSNTGDIGLFRFTDEEAVGAGLRRVEAVTGRAAQQYTRERLDTLGRVAQMLNVPEDQVEERLGQLLAEQHAMEKRLEQLQRSRAMSQFEELLDDVLDVNGVAVLAAEVEVAGADQLREMADWYRDRIPSGAAVFATIRDGKPLIVATVTRDVIERGVKAGDLAREVARIVGGGGGGRPDLAQAGGRDPERLPEALASVRRLVEEAMA